MMGDPLYPLQEYRKFIRDNPRVACGIGDPGTPSSRLASLAWRIQEMTSQKNSRPVALNLRTSLPSSYEISQNQLREAKEVLREGDQARTFEMRARATFCAAGPCMWRDFLLWRDSKNCPIRECGSPIVDDCRFPSPRRRGNCGGYQKLSRHIMLRVAAIKAMTVQSTKPE